MKSRPTFLLALIAALAVTLSCQLVDQARFSLSEQIVRGSGNVVSEPRPVNDFTRIELAGIGDVELVVGDPATLTITAEANLLPLITSEVTGDTLRIGLVEGRTPAPTHPIRLDVTTPLLEGVSISGLSSVHIQPFNASRFEADLPGAGSLVIESLTADSLDAQLPGLGSFEVHGGAVQDAVIDISGAGNFEAPDLQIASAEVSISGLGSATVRVSETLDAEISGGGSVRYYGSPAVTENVSGLGNVEKAGD
jgi:hypothetical protein